jgi:hypothetical protein
MKLTDAVTYFGSQWNVANALGIKQSSVNAWRNKNGGNVPPEHQLRLLKLSKGTLKVDAEEIRNLYNVPEMQVIVAANRVVMSFTI